MKDTITYLEDTTTRPLVFKDDPLWHHKKGLMQTATGYGRKLATERKVLYNGRWQRVYCMIYSNAGSIYIISKGKKLFIRS